MFEKSLYDLIRGLRAAKGKEREYILESIKDCRKEVQSQDLDIKATAILKLVYLEMFGHDMSWASFHVLETMSSSKFHHKRIGYLGAIQSFTLETDVLMLATNLLKKDLSSASPFDVSLAINGLSHIVSPSLARDLSSDLITKMNHTDPYIRKKAILVMYKCFLQAPELLRTAWPRLREGLADEDISVVNATVNVICELAKKNPKNYLPLAPQLFGLLTSSTNNWMTIKIIKLFATLTPLEPRLTKKLVPPITNLIKTTQAMSLLYECINGLISGGLLAAMGDTDEGEELAGVCVSKLRGFLVEGDSNLKYVGLLALAKIVITHPHLVSLHQDVILDCIDDPDITIRLRALELVAGMVNIDNLTTVVGRLMRQLKPPQPQLGQHLLADYNDFANADVDSDFEAEDDDFGVSAKKSVKPAKEAKPLTTTIPESYKVGVIKRILEMCSKDMYANISDFEWYLDVLMQLIRYAPAVSSPNTASPGEYYDGGDEPQEDEAGERSTDVGEDIGNELRNVAVRVRAVRPESVRMADLLVRRKDGMFPTAGGGGKRALLNAGWIVGEYASLLPDPAETITALINESQTYILPADILAIYIQALPKLYANITGDENVHWTTEKKSKALLLTNRIVKFLEPLATNPDLEVQERAIEFLELFRLATEAISTQPTASPNDPASYDYEPPRLLTQAIPGMFSGMELNPVAARAQRKVPLPPNLDLNEPINPNLHQLLVEAENEFSAALGTDDEDEFDAYYYKRPSPLSSSARAISASQAIDIALSRSTSNLSGPTSYQTAEDSYFDPDIVARRKAERRERNRDDPFYIGDYSASPKYGVSPRQQNPLKGVEVDIDSIPVMKLDFGDVEIPLAREELPRRKQKAKVEVVGDETIGGAEKEPEAPKAKGKKKRNLLSVDGSGLIGYSLEEDEDERRAAERQEEIRKAKAEVEKFRLEMERAAGAKAAKEKELVMAASKPARSEKPKKVNKNVTAGKDGPDQAPTKPKKKKKAMTKEVTAEGEAKIKAKKKKVKMPKEKEVPKETSPGTLSSIS